MELKNQAEIIRQHKLFIQNICRSEVVWGLENKEGMAISNSWEYVNDKGDAIGLICFWSQKASAVSCAKDEWHDYQPIEIPLYDFIEIYCLGLANDGFMAGTDFDVSMYGFEIDPLDLILEINEELITQQKTIKLKNYPTMQSLVDEIEDLLNG